MLKPILLVILFAQPADFSGVYRVNGKEGDYEYKAICEIIKLDGGGYWVYCASANRISRGIGTVVDGKLVVATRPDEGKGICIAVYRLVDGKLEGDWQAQPGLTSGTETLTPLEPKK